ncbi:MAG TPA: WD40 repeat domain-containing protein [Terriglobales bacterium]|nr:WD40 repeat domain-containing protein [Terriglobales bacterium]
MASMNSNRLVLFIVILAAAMTSSAADFPKWKPRKAVAVGSSPKVIRYSPDGKLIAVGDADGNLRIIAVDSGSVIKTVASDLKPLLEIHFLPKSGRLLACGGENQVQVFSAADWKAVANAEGIRACEASEEENLLVGGDGKKQGEALVLWDVRDLKPMRPLFSKGARPVDPSFVKGGQVAVSVARVPYLVDVKTGQATKIQQTGDASTAVKFEKGQGNQAAFSLGAMQDDDAPTHRVAASWDGELVALGRGWFGQPDFVDVWAVSGMKRLLRIKEENTGTDASLSFDDQMVAVGSSKPGNVSIYRIKDKKKTTLQGSNLFQFNPKSLELAVVQDETLSFYVPPK